ncbi:hypothetical protein [Bacillus sp. AK128]
MKKSIILIVLVLLGMSIYFVIGLFNTNPPEPTITAEGERVEVVQGSYCWDGLLSSICADTSSPPELVKDQGLKPVVVSPESKIKIEFKKEPNENSLGVSNWTSDNEIDEVSLRSNNVLRAPKEKGIYVYDVHASWEKGSSSFAFVIEVQ